MRDATIKDIAVAAGVSPSTVSRVINDNYPVSADVRKRVQDAIAALHYRPNAIARSLRASQSYLVALVVADLSNLYFMDAAKGLEETLGQYGYSLVIASSDGKPEKERKLLQTLVERRVDGICIASVDTDGTTIQGAIQAGIPVVLMDREVPSVHSNQVIWNDFDTASMLTRLFLEKGHEEIGIVNVTLSHSVGRQRLEGFRSAIKKAGLSLPKEYISASNFSDEDAYQFVRKLMSKKRHPTALLCSNNVTMEGTLSALGELHLEVGRDVSLAAIGRLMCNRYITPKITTAELDSLLMGKRTGAILLDQIRGNGLETTQIILKATLCLGDSIADRRKA